MISREIEIHFELLSKCQFRCIHCSSGSHADYDKSIPYSSIISFIKTIEKDLRMHVFFTGGEPLNLPKLPKLISEFSNRANVIDVGLFTTGCFFERTGVLRPVGKSQARILSKNGLSSCYLSLYAPTSEIHDRITQVPGSFDCVLKTIKNLKCSKIIPKVNFPIMKINRKLLNKTALFCENIGVNEIRFLRLVKHGRAKNNWNEIGLSSVLQKKIAYGVIKQSEKKYGNIKITLAGFPELFKCRPFNIGQKCQAGINLFYVDIKGNVFPCACKKRDATFKLGSIYDKKIQFNTNIPVAYHKRCLQDL